MLGLIGVWPFLASPDVAHAQRSGLLDPVGTWNCLVYGRPVLADERVFLELEADGSTAILRLRGGESLRWTAISNWRRRRKRLAFRDAAAGRTFEADLTSSSLGGAWRTAMRDGGWWCVRVAGGAAPSRTVDAPAWTAELVPAVTAAPEYPRAAIRAGREGRTVGCFFVNSNGEVVDPVVVDLSDEVFREPTLVALARSRYRGWADDAIVHPDCRSFVFRLGESGTAPLF